MSIPSSRAAAAAAYARLLQETYPSATPAAAPALSRAELQQLWLDGRLGQSGATEHHGALRVLDFGAAAPEEGTPAILRADIELDGKRYRGDIALHPCAEAWEQEGCGERASYNNVVLHVVLRPVPQGRFTRTSAHAEVPIRVIPQPQLRKVCGCAALFARPASALPLRHMSAEEIRTWLINAAAYRADIKRELFACKTAVVGQEQAWFEAWAEVLGYSANKCSMLRLARRAPLSVLYQGDAEAILLGTAGFLQAVLPERSTDEARAYHRRLWGAWWQLRERFADGAPLVWALSAVRPMNHPNRRVAALALSAKRWAELLPLMNAAGAKRLTEELCALSHPFWDTHCTLAAAPLRRKCALVGASRAADFLSNVVYPLDAGEAAWATYLTLRANDIPRKIERIALSLFGDRPELRPLLKHQYAQQALLQWAADFGDNGAQAAL